MKIDQMTATSIKRLTRLYGPESDKRHTDFRINGVAVISLQAYVTDGVALIRNKDARCNDVFVRAYEARRIKAGEYETDTNDEGFPVIGYHSPKLVDYAGVFNRHEEQRRLGYSFLVNKGELMRTLQSHHKEEVILMPPRLVFIDNKESEITDFVVGGTVIKAEGTFPAPAMTVKLERDRLIRLLRVFPEKEINLVFTSSKQPVQVVSDTHEAVIMPIQKIN